MTTKRRHQCTLCFLTGLPANRPLRIVECANRDGMECRCTDFPGLHRCGIALNQVPKVKAGVDPFGGRCVVVLTVLLSLFFCARAQSQQVLLRHSSLQPTETCPEHVALSRHWLIEASRASPVKWHRDWLKRQYKESFKPEKIARVCQDNKTQAQFDIDLADIRLQLGYDLLRKQELKHLPRGARIVDFNEGPGACHTNEQTKLYDLDGLLYCMPIGRE